MSSSGPVPAARKQAVLVMAHGRFEQLVVLLGALDSERFDLFVHVDAKAADVPWEFLRSSARRSGLRFARDRRDVAWGGVSQVLCELDLLSWARASGDYSYYHLLSGQDLPLRPAEEVWAFFDSHYGREFVSVKCTSSDPGYPADVWRRYGVWHPFPEAGRSRSAASVLRRKADSLAARVQEAAGVDRACRSGLCAKGSNWFSITDSFAGYLLARRGGVEAEFCDRTVFCDEVFLQSALIRSPYWGRRWADADEHHQAMRHIDWERGDPYVWRMGDLEELTSSGMMFARKFDWDVDRKIIFELARRCRS